MSGYRRYCRVCGLRRHGGGGLRQAIAGPAQPPSSPSVGPQSNPNLTLQALPGNTLAGHTFKFYRVATYIDVIPSVGPVSSFDLASVSAAMTNEINSDLAANGFTGLGTPEHILAGLSSESNLHDIAKSMASYLASTPPDATVTGSGTADTIALDPGYYLIVDSAGNPIMFGTRTSDGRNLSSQDNTKVTIKSTGNNAEGPSINTDPGTDPTNPLPAQDHSGKHIPGDNQGDSSVNSSKHIVKIAGTNTTSHLHGVFALPGNETGHNTSPNFKITTTGTGSAVVGTVTIKVNGAPVTLTPSSSGVYDLSSQLAGSKV